MTIILNGTTGITTPGITNQGVVEFTAGSVSAPSITTTGDTNTGIYFPAADTIAFTEGGVESLRIDSSGNVGIGTASPAMRVDVQKSDGSGRQDLMRVLAGGNSNGNGASIALGSTQTQCGYITGLQTGSNEGALVFGLQSSGAYAERARIDSSGNLGLGVTPSAWDTATFRGFQVGGSNSATLAGRTDNVSDMILGNNVYFASSSFRYVGTGTASYYRQDTGNHVWFSATSGTAGDSLSGSTAMILNTSGNLGIGTSSPTAKLHVKSASAAADPSAIIENAGSTATSLLYFKNNASRQMLVGYTGASYSGGEYGIVDVLGAFPLLFATNDTERCRITSGGDLLVGTTSALSGAGRFQVLGAATTAAANIQVGTNGYAAINFNNAGASQQGYIVTNAASVAYTSISDYRLKNTIAPMTSALAKVALLKPCTYKWNADGSDGQGFIAHELAEVVPDCVTGEKDAVDSEGKPQYQGVDTSFLVATLTAAIQELSAKVTALESK